MSLFFIVGLIHDSNNHLEKKTKYLRYIYSKQYRGSKYMYVYYVIPLTWF